MNSTPTPTMETPYTDYKNSSNVTTAPPFSCGYACLLYAVMSVIIVILGVVGNGLVIWIAGFKIKKSVNATWYLSLALSDFFFCCTLPIDIVDAVKNDWILGHFMCKFMFFNIYFNAFSSILILAIISVDRCVVVVFPVWAQNKRTARKASVIVFLVWIFSALCSMPSVYYLDVQYNPEYMRNLCFHNYENYEHAVSDVVCKFVFGFVIPFLIIIFCYVVIVRKLKSNQMAKSPKPFKVMTVLITAFLICFLPFHIVSLINLNYETFTLKGLLIVSIFSNANSCLNPFLYTFMGKDFKKQCFAVLSKIENAIREDESQ